MPITTELISADPDTLSIVPEVAVLSNVLKIGATTLKFDGIDSSVAETTYTATTKPVATGVEVIIVRRLSDDAVLYLVDEVASDGTDIGYSFKESPYVPLHYLASFKIPANTTDLTACAIRVLKTTPHIITFPSPQGTEEN